MRILICKSGEFGGTDFLLTRYYEWLIHNFIEADIVVPSDEKLVKAKRKYDLIMLPSSQMYHIPKLRLKGYHFKRMLIWIMGCGSFSDTYFNCDRNNGIERSVNVFLDFASKKFVKQLYLSDSICFTDEVGMAITFEGTKVLYNERKKENIIPIAIKISSEDLNFVQSQGPELRLCWIGRVSKDFKFIPIVQLMNDIENYISKGNNKIALTIIGDGDGLEEVKEEAETKTYPIEFKDSISYEDIGDYLKLNADILIAMGTSALDGAKYGCPSVVITPVKPSDKKSVYYRWVFESKGYSLGEYSSIKVGPKQPKMQFEELCQDYYRRKDIGKLSYEYTKYFDEDIVFKKLLKRSLPDRINFIMWVHIYIFTVLKSAKTIIKKCRK